MVFLKKHKSGLIFILCVFLIGCGYRFLGSGELPGGVEKVFVDVLENTTSETAAETLFTNALRYEFIRQERNADRDEAEAVLSGIIKSLTYKTITHQQRHEALERRVYVTIALKLTDRQGNILWSNQVSAREAYGVLDDKFSTEQNRRRAISKLSERLAENTYYRLTDNF